ncbi:MAG: hypothetical protein INH13_30345 [Cupriavidus sp.]|nr:hypothetical protein [Cupriavidus sp.]
MSAASNYTENNVIGDRRAVHHLQRPDRLEAMRGRTVSSTSVSLRGF